MFEILSKIEKCMFTTYRRRFSNFSSTCCPAVPGRDKNKKYTKENKNTKEIQNVGFSYMFVVLIAVLFLYPLYFGLNFFTVFLCQGRSTQSLSRLQRTANPTGPLLQMPAWFVRNF